MKPFMRTVSPYILRSLVAVALTILATSALLADATTFVSDDFNMRNLNRPLWIFADPEGDSALRLVDTGTDIAAVQFILTQGNAHDITSSGYSVPRIIQAATNTDFRLEAKFLSGLAGGTTQSYQFQGLVVEQDGSNFIRFDFTTGTTPDTRLYCASFVGGLGSPVVRYNQPIVANGTNPLWMRVERVGNNWTQFYSLDSTNWTMGAQFTLPLAVAQVGVFAGNAGSAPSAFASRVDYFRNLDSLGMPEDSLTTPPDAIAPLIYNVQAVQVAPNALELAWSTDELSTGVLQYGTSTSYGSSVSSTTPSTSHKVLITGLVSNTSYDYRVTASDDSGNVEVGTNNIKRTARYVFDVASVSDDFSAAALNTNLWSFVNPVGDGTVSIASGEAQISVPAGVDHDIWSAGARAPRIMQPVANPTIMELEAKFLSGVTGSGSSYQLQGIFVEQDSKNAIRFDFVNGGGATKIFASTFSNGYGSPSIKINTNALPLGASPSYLRVKQLGAQWTVEYSADGVSWSTVGTFWHILTPSAVGVYGGNAGSNPAFTARVDYFRAVLPAEVALTAPADGTTGLEVSPTLSWGGALQSTWYHVQVATDNQFNTVVLSDTTVLGTSRIANGLSYSTQFFWRVRGKSAAGYGTFSPAWSFTTRSSAPNTPVLLTPANGTTGVSTSPTLSWNKIPLATSYRVQVSTEGSFTTGLVVDDPAVADTTRPLTALIAGTTYFWRVNASAPGGTSEYSVVFSFTTVTAAPGVVTLVSPDNGADVPATGVTFTWLAAANATKYAHELAVDPLFQFLIVDSALTGTSKNVTGLIADQTYYWRVKAGNISGWGPYSEARSFIAITSGVNEGRGIPKEFGLAQNYPNPFNPSTSIEFALPMASPVRLEVYSLIGERVAVLVNGPMQAGYHTVSFNAADLPSGLYLYRFESSDHVFTRKMLLVK